ncbi:MAG: Anhydro-N-acetylmuramic acid kinase [Ferruginibacter sp.]|nr:Anhydro-N-acetylmuramic acid kinase [Ferruginibacter sp.]
MIYKNYRTKPQIMNANINRLFNMGQSPSRLIIGLMSGTSVDGLDVALCRCKGFGPDTEIDIIQFETVSYPDDYRQEIKSVFSKRAVDLEKVCLLNEWIAVQHANIINDCLKKWKIDPATVDLVASHGQTIYHAPKFLHGQEKFPNATLQIGDGDHLAVKTGIITISDFRQKHIAAGGEGAPLAVYGDFLIFSKKGENRILLNIGGIANFTYLPGDLDGEKVFSTDTGPGNTLMDAFVQQNFSGKYFDEQSAIAGKGVINEKLLFELKKNEFFQKDFPKTTGPELFNLAYVDKANIAAGTSSIMHEDLMATLNRFSADTIVDAIQRSSSGLTDVVVYTSGGGMHNPILMENIRQQLPGYSFQTTDALGINPDAKEALLFAVLANEAVAGGKTEIGNGSSDIPFVSMGKISFPF